MADTLYIKDGSVEVLLREDSFEKILRDRLGNEVADYYKNEIDELKDEIDGLKREYENDFLYEDDFLEKIESDNVINISF